MAVIRTCLKLLAVGLLISAVAVRADDDDEDEEGDADAGASVGTVAWRLSCCRCGLAGGTRAEAAHRLQATSAARLIAIGVR